ncbi:MAG TPA: hypothetical protein VNJ07_13725, partial [Chitinophagales bacterium]|nr:hypothetical protein [Chitinophagales bacterium]
GYELLLTMDCDFTHSPEYIFDFLHNRSRADVIVGSRYLKKDSLATWSLFRKSLTRLGHFFTSELLDMPYDASNAFRLYNLQSIDRHLFSLVQSEGYAFFFESLFILHVNGKKVFEIPIGLPSRAHGDSKMTWKDGMESARLMLSLYGRKLFNSQSLRLK